MVISAVLSISNAHRWSQQWDSYFFVGKYPSIFWTLTFNHIRTCIFDKEKCFRTIWYKTELELLKLYLRITFILWNSHTYITCLLIRSTSQVWPPVLHKLIKRTKSIIRKKKVLFIVTTLVNMAESLSLPNPSSCFWC